MKPRTIIALAVFAVLAVAFAISFSGSTSSYLTFRDAKTSGKTVHVVGEWVNRDQATYDVERDVFSFFLKDSTNYVQQVRYMDPKPMNFDAAERVVIVGKYHQEDFVADQIIMKCPSKYGDEDITAGEGTDL